MQISEFDYSVPDGQIAQHPLKDRDTSRLLVLGRHTGSIEHKFFKDIQNYLRDGDVLRSIQFERLLKAEKLKQGNSKTDLTEIVLEPHEKDALILTAYDKAEFPKPLNDDGNEKELTIEEKEQLLITSIKISEFDLKEVAMVRAENVKTYLLSTGKISPERIFLRNPKPEIKELQSEVEENRYSKVLFLLK